MYDGALHQVHGSFERREQRPCQRRVQARDEEGRHHRPQVSGAWGVTIGILGLGKGVK